MATGKSSKLQKAKLVQRVQRALKAFLGSVVCLGGTEPKVRQAQKVLLGSVVFVESMELLVHEENEGSMVLTVDKELQGPKVWMENKVFRDRPVPEETWVPEANLVSGALLVRKVMWEPRVWRELSANQVW